MMGLQEGPTKGITWTSLKLIQIISLSAKGGYHKHPKAKDAQFSPETHLHAERFARGTSRFLASEVKAKTQRTCMYEQQKGGMGLF